MPLQAFAPAALRPAAPCGGLWALSIKKHQIYGIMSMHSPKLILTLDVVSSEHIGCHARRIFNHVLEMPVRSLPSLARARASTSSSRSGVIIALIASHKTWTCASSRVHASTCKIDPLHFRLLVTCCDIHVKRAALWRQPAIRELSRFYEWYYQDIPAKYRALHCDIQWWWKVSGAKVTFVRAIPRKHFSFKKSKTWIWYRQDVELPTYKNSETEPEQKYPSGLEMKDFFITGNLHR